MLTEILVAATAVTVLSLSAWAQTPEDLRGTWTLVSSVTDKDGNKTEQFGHGAKGLMVWIAGDISCSQLSVRVFQNSRPTAAPQGQLRKTRPSCQRASG